MVIGTVSTKYNIRAVNVPYGLGKFKLAWEAAAAPDQQECVSCLDPRQRQIRMTAGKIAYFLDISI
jgi:hypothetical protein